MLRLEKNVDFSLDENFIFFKDHENRRIFVKKELKFLIGNFRGGFSPIRVTVFFQIFPMGKNNVDSFSGPGCLKLNCSSSRAPLMLGTSHIASMVWRKSP